MASQKAEERYGLLLRRFAPNALHEQYQFLNVLQEHVKPGMRWLDAGCGHTLVPPWIRGAKEIEERLVGTASSVIGCDIDPCSLEKESRITRVGCTLEQLCFPSEHFDLITSNMVVEHLANPEKVFREFHRVLKPGGTVLLLTPNMLHWTMLISRFTPHWFHVLIRAKIMGSDPEDVFPVFYRSNTQAAMTRNLKAAGFDNVNVDLWASRPHLVGTGPLLWLELLIFRLTRPIPQLREILCGIARKT